MSKAILIFVLQACILFIHAQTDTMRTIHDSLKIKPPAISVKSPLLNSFQSGKDHIISLKSEEIIKPVIDSSKLKVTNPFSGNDSTELTFSKLTNKKKDSTNAKPNALDHLKVLIPKGTISVGYDYGFLPYTVNMPSPASATRSEGLIQTDVFSIPVNASYFYSSQKNLIGLNNYFKISYDADRYKDKLTDKLAGQLDSYKNLLGKLNLKKQEVLQKMAYADYLSGVSPDKWPIDESTLRNVVSVQTNTGSRSMPDSAALAEALLRKSGAGKYPSKQDSIRQKLMHYKRMADSVASVYDRYKNKYDHLTDTIKSLQSKISDLENIVNSGPSAFLKNSPYLNKFQNFMSGVKKLDVGLCYPNYSTFLANNIPVRGINFEYQKNNNFFVFTYGTTVSTLLYNNKTPEGILANLKNSLNYFDANNLSSGRKILSVKFGTGTKEGDHFFVGFLIGKGADTYFPPAPTDANTHMIETNLVIEADVRKKLFKNTFLDVNLGKSSVQDADLNLGTLHSAAKELFSNFRSYAALIRLSTCIKATRSNLTASVRWVDPFFNSFGIGFIRSDNMRYELKLDQPLTKQLRYTVMLRYEEDNLLKLLNYRNTFYSLNNTFSYKIKRGLMLRASYTPLLRTLKGDNTQQKYNSSIVTGILTFTPKSRTAQIQFHILYNHYLVNTDSTPVNFNNFTYYHQITLNNGFKTGLNVSWFKNNLKDTSGNNVFLAVLDAGYQFKNGTAFSAGFKSAYKPHGGFYPGFIFKSTLKLSKALFWEVQAEKFIIGDLFNSYDLYKLKRFPYCFTTKLILNF